jgi:signal peptidase II
MKERNRSIAILTIILLSIITDQITKIVAKAILKSSPPIIYFGDLFRFQYAENTGAMLGFGSDLPDGLRFWLLTVLVGALLVVLLIFLFYSQKLSKAQTIALALISGGGLSNFIDRVLNDGRVVDFMNMGIGFLRTGIFNVADVLIMIGLGMILVFGEWTKKKEGAQSAE